MPLGAKNPTKSEFIEKSVKLVAEEYDVLRQENAKLKAKLKQLQQEIGELEHVNLMLVGQNAANMTTELDIDGFQEWIRTLNPNDHVEKYFIVNLQKYGQRATLAYFKSLYQKYQKH